MSKRADRASSGGRRIAYLSAAAALLFPGIALPARADVELPPEEAPPPRPLTPYGEDDLSGPPPVYREDIYVEDIEAPPPGLEPGLFSGARMGPYPRIGADLDLIGGAFRSRMQYQSGDGGGNEILLHKDLPEPDDDDGWDSVGAGEVRLWLMLSPHWSITAGYLHLQAEGSGPVSRTFLHDAASFSEGDEVRFEVSTQMAWIGARVLAVNTPHFKFGIPIGAMWTRQTLEIENRSTGETGEGAIDAWSPYLGLYLDIHFGYGFGIESEVRFFAWGEEDRHLFGYVDGRAVLYMTFFDHLRVYAGVRGIATDYLREGRNDRQSDWRLAGLVAGASLYF